MDRQKVDGSAVCSVFPGSPLIYRNGAGGGGGGGGGGEPGNDATILWYTTSQLVVSPDDLYLGDALHLLLLPQRVTPVQVEEEHHKCRQLLCVLVQPTHLQDA